MNPIERNPTRRTILLSSSAVLPLLAGCTGERPEEEPVDDESEDEEPVEDEPSDDEPIDDAEASAEIIDSEVFAAPFHSDGEGGEVPWMQIDVRNDTVVLHGPLRVESRFRSEDDEIIKVSEGYTSYLPANTIWRNYLREDFDMSELDHVETTIIERNPRVTSSEIQSASILNSSMSFDGSAVTITGEVDIGDAAVSRVVVVGLVYDEEELFRGAVTDVETEPDAVDTIAFRAGLVGFRTPVNRAEPDSYEIVVLDGHP